MGKNDEGVYDKVLPNLPSFKEDAPVQQKIDAIKATIRATDAISLANGYIEARQAKKAIEQDLAKINQVLTAYEQLIADSQERGGAYWGEYGVKDNALRLTSGDIIRVRREPYINVVDQEAYRLWCIANGYQRDLHMHSSKTSAIGRERLLAGEEEPDGIKIWSKVKVFFFPAE